MHSKQQAWKEMGGLWGKVWLTFNYMWQRSWSGHQLKHISVWISLEVTKLAKWFLANWKPPFPACLGTVWLKGGWKRLKYSDAHAFSLLLHQASCVIPEIITVIHSLSWHKDWVFLIGGKANSFLTSFSECWELECHYLLTVKI